jgi:tetratricopeptide (TPR) repeat protein
MRRHLIALCAGLLTSLGADGSAKAQQVAEAPASTTPARADEPATRSQGMLQYQQALEKRRLAATAPLSSQRLREDLAAIEGKLFVGRRDEAIGDLVYIVESPRFGPFAQTEEGKAAVFLLGDALGRVGAYQPARGYLKRLLSGDPLDTWYRRAARSLVDFGLESARPEPFLSDLAMLPAAAPAELLADVAYLRGRAFERQGKRPAALVEYARVSARSRFWAQANYLSGLIEVERGDLKKGESLLCKIADPKLTPRDAPLFGGTDFFRIRDLARLGLGRIAHETFRFDDAQYYYYLVPRDSEHLPEALYETATTRYEAKDYDSAREYMDELRALGVNHPYEDEAWILDAYIDLAVCEFPRASAKLQLFLVRYEPVRDAARRLAKDDTAVRKLADAARLGTDPAAVGLGVGAGTARTLVALLRVDADYNGASRRLAQLDHQLSGLRRAMAELDEARRKLASPAQVRPHAQGPLAESDAEKLERIESQLAELRRLLRETQRRGKNSAILGDLEKQVATLELRARAARAGAPSAVTAAAARGTDLLDVITADRERATELHNQAQTVRQKVVDQQVMLAKDALTRLDRRLSRLLSRARLGRIETVLGRKRALELEIEALSQGLLPQTIVDSLDAERYLRDDEEYWPFEGEDWADEYVGGEGLR